MRANRIRIRDFRSLRDLDLDLRPTTVLIGENNAGKTSLLDAIKLTLSHRWGVRGTGFEEYDFYLNKEHSDPKKSPGVRIEIDCNESPDAPWTDDVITDLLGDKILQTKADGKNLVTIRAEYKYNDIAKIYESMWCFLNLEGIPTRKPSSRATNLYPSFFNYLPVFSLSALRDAGTEFSSRSQFWGKLIKSINISDEDWESVSKDLDKLNELLVSTDPKFAAIKRQLGRVRSVISESVESIELRALPLQVWDLIAKTELLLRATEEESYLPLSRFGQGVQSLAVVNVFRAFIDNLLAEEYEIDSSPILLMEEPESHLHPQAARAFYGELNGIPGQKIVTTHSPYFLQNVPFRDIRLLRKTKAGVKPFYLRPVFRFAIQKNARIERLLVLNHETWSYNDYPAELIVSGSILPAEIDSLLACYTTKEEKAENHDAIEAVRQQTLAYMPDTELTELQDSAKRIRGEIFFARKWLLVEGQSDYIVLSAASEILDYPFDANGVSVIDVQNCGKSESFAALARVFGFPWAALFDGDNSGNDLVQKIKKRNFSKTLQDNAIFQFPSKSELEDALVASLPSDIVDAILKELGKYDGVSTISDKTRAKLLKKRKILTASKLAEKVRAGLIQKTDLPKEIVAVIEYLRSAEEYQ